MRFRTTTSTIAAAAALGLGMAALATTPAHAAPESTATVVHEDSELWYKAGAGQQNKLTVDEKTEQRGENEYYYILTFRDQHDIAIDASAAEADECTYPTEGDRTAVQCAVLIPQNSDDSDNYDIDLGDMDDTATLGPDSDAYVGVYGGPGNDTLTGNAAPTFHGGDGDDSIDGGGGVFGFGSYGDAGDDTLVNCAQDCFGGPGNDELTGTDEDNTLHGDDGNDVIRGGGGADVLYGGRHDDELYGEDGADTIWGNSGNDVLWGGAGTDTLSGGPGRNEVHQD